MKKFLLSLALILTMTGIAIAEESSFSLEWGAANWDNNSSYTGTLTSKNQFGGSNWILSAFNNNNNAWSNVRCGRKTYESTASISNETALQQTVTKIVVNTTFEKPADASNLTSATLYISKSQDYTDAVKVPYAAIETAGDWTFDVPEANATDGFYKVEFVCASAANNGFLGVNKFTVYYEGTGGGTTDPDPGPGTDPGTGDGDDDAPAITITTTETKAANNSTTYVIDPTSVTVGNYTFVFDEFNPSSGQMRVNQIGEAGFNLYNTTAIEDLSAIVITTDGGQTGLGTWYMTVGKNEAITAPATTEGIAGVNGTNQITFVVPEGQDATYFHLNLTAKGGGTCKFTKIEIYTGEFDGGQTPPTPDTPEAPEGIITVAKAMELISQGYEGAATVKGYISAITDMSNTDSGSTYGNATYTIVDELNSNQAPLTVFRGFWMDGEKFATGKEIAVGGLVTVEGSLVNYNGTYEFTSGSKVVAYTAPEGGETPEPEPGDEADVFINWSQQGYENGEIVTELVKDDVTVALSKGKGSTQPAYYDSGTALRLYGSNTMTISVPDGVAIAKIVFTTASGTNAFNSESTASSGTFDITAKTWTATSNNVGSVMFTQGGTSGHVKILTTSIYLADAGDDERVEVGSEEPAPVVKMTVKEALEAIAGNNIPAGDVQVTGYISKISEYSTEYGNATFLIVDEFGDENALTVFRCKWLNNEKFAEDGLIKEGGRVTVEGTLQDYNGTPELTNCYVVSYDGSTAAVSAIEADGGAIYFNLQGQRVANPDRGIFIRVQNGKATKILK